MMSEKLSNFCLLIPFIFIYDRSGYKKTLRYVFKEGRKQLAYTYEDSESILNQKNMKYSYYGGTAILISGFISIIYSLGYIGIASIIGLEFSISLMVLSFLYLIFGLGSIIGGYMAMTQRSFTLGIVGGIFCILTFNLILPLLLGIIGIVFIIIGKDEF